MPLVILAVLAAQMPAEAAAAFHKAFGSPMVTLEGETIKYEPVALVDVEGRPVLVAKGTVIDAAHVTSGKVAAIYFGPDSEVQSRHLKAVESGSSGIIADVSLSSNFGALPMIVAQGGGTWQAIAATWSGWSS